jgi:hypothetical protein
MKEERKKGGGRRRREEEKKRNGLGEEKRGCWNQNERKEEAEECVRAVGKEEEEGDKGV